ncbi:MAG: hypothetical protein CV087_00700 [Candidatus Brocadia sp. WS118]|nr:MAG: hypothetical protein CV087_00700 [Candidatus Brocadia sp. WS118]
MGEKACGILAAADEFRLLIQESPIGENKNGAAESENTMNSYQLTTKEERIMSKSPQERLKQADYDMKTA